MLIDILFLNYSMKNFTMYCVISVVNEEAINLVLFPTCHIIVSI